LFETRREIKIDIFISQFTEFVRFFNITIGESIQIRTEYRLWFIGKSIDLQDIFLDIPDEIEFTLPYAERHLKPLLMTYADFYRKYIICPEETLAVYGLLKNIDNYIDLKLGRFPLNIYQQDQITVAKNKFINGYLEINKVSFKSKDLLNQYNDEKEEPISLDLSPLKIKNTLLKHENRICFLGKEKEGVEKLSKKIQQEMNSYKKEPISVYSNEKEVIYNPESDKLIHKKFNNR
jgi:hypothetical protein